LVWTFKNRGGITRWWANITEKDEDGRTALHLSAGKGHIDVVQNLLLKGVDVNIKDNFGRTSLHLGAHNGQVEVVKLLLENVDHLHESARDMFGRTLLDLAQRSPTRQQETLFILRRAYHSENMVSFDSEGATSNLSLDRTKQDTLDGDESNGLPERWHGETISV